MSALNSLPLPVVRLLAFFHEELSERRPGRVPQTVQLWVGCLLVILISMTFEIPFVALSLAVLFYGIQSNAFYTKFVAILFVVATVLEIGSLFLIYKWSYGEPLIRLIIAGPILMGCMFLMRTHRLGLVFFAVAIVAIYGQTFPAMLDYPEVVVRLTLWCIVVGLYPTLLMTLIGVLWFPSRAISQMATVRAPFDGRVISLKTSVGQFASAMRPIFTLIDTRHWYVIANFRETDLKNIRSGTPATIRLMSDSGKTFEGKVDSIGYGVLPDDGGLVLGGLPKVSRSINWVRVAQRFPVKIMVDKPDPEMFRIGASAVANLEPQ